MVKHLFGKDLTMTPNACQEEFKAWTLSFSRRKEYQRVYMSTVPTILDNALVQIEQKYIDLFS